MRIYPEVVASVLARLTPARTATGIASVALVWLVVGMCPVAAQGAFTVSSTDLHDGSPVHSEQVYDKDACTGGNVSPQLSWRNAPPGTKSFAVTIFDRDAPGPGWWHWAVAGIPPRIDSLPANASASGALKQMGAIEARNDYGDTGYGGPCPPPGKPHRYVVTVFALNTADLRLGPARHALMFDHEINTSVLAKAQLTVTYGR
jgi:hypothetical protein